MRWRCPAIALAAVLALVATARRLPAQVEAPDCTASQAPRTPRAQLGEMGGRLIDDSTGKPIAGRGVDLHRTSCSTSTDDHGRFVLRYLPPGVYELRVGTLGYRKLAPVDVTVRADERASVE